MTGSDWTWMAWSCSLGRMAVPPDGFRPHDSVLDERFVDQDGGPLTTNAVQCVLRRPGCTRIQACEHQVVAPVQEIQAVENPKNGRSPRLKRSRQAGYTRRTWQSRASGR